jgi:hypothetical protein
MKTQMFGFRSRLGLCVCECILLEISVTVIPDI